MASFRMQEMDATRALPGDLVYRRGDGDGNGRCQVIVLNEENATNYCIMDVLIPLPGCDVLMPTHELTQYCSDLMLKDGLTLQSFDHSDRYHHHRHFHVQQNPIPISVPIPIAIFSRITLQAIQV